MAQYVMHTDGGARGNPGPAGAGVAIYDDHGTVVAELARPLGTMTNNQAEYWAVIHGLEKLSKLATESMGVGSVMIKLDSQLVAEQLKGNYKLKNEGLKPLHTRVQSLIVQLAIPVEFQYIPRRENKHADLLANKAMDEIDKYR